MVVVILVCIELLDAVGVDTTPGVIKLEEHDWLELCDDLVDDVRATVVVGVELRIDPIDEVGTRMVVVMELTTGGVVVPTESTMRYDGLDVAVLSEGRPILVDAGCVTTSVIVCFETEGRTGEAVTVLMLFKV